jgi:hypothetical protein
MGGKESRRTGTGSVKVTGTGGKTRRTRGQRRRRDGRVDPQTPDDPQPNVHRIIRPKIEAPCPWSDGELEGIVEAACRFIEEAKERHGTRFGWEVGRYLYVEVYRRDDAYLRRKDPRKEDSLRDIAKASGVPYSRLYYYLRAGWMRDRLVRAGFGEELSMAHMKHLHELGDDIVAIVALARWARANKVSAEALDPIANRWREHLDEGGTSRTSSRSPCPSGGRRGRGARPRTSSWCPGSSSSSSSEPRTAP